jgi:2-succinyl-6-hydroxy-2,4-cyclohexadiene-1-carboxylate synthase
MAVHGNVSLNVEVSGEGPALLMLHGFTGDHTTWDPFVQTDDFSHFKTIRVDIIGHGASDSPLDPLRYSMRHAVEDLTSVLDQLGVDRYALLGYSMGARVALHLALAHGERLWGLILESGSPGLPTPEERLARRRADVELARTLWEPEEQLGEPPAGLVPFIDRWQDQALFQSQQRLPAEVLARQRALRLSQDPIGLANSLRGMGTGTQDFLLPRLGELKVATLLQAGSLDSRYVVLGEAMQKQIENSTLQVIEDAGHAAHLEQPAEFQRGVTVFLAVTLMELAGRQHVEEEHGFRLG